MDKWDFVFGVAVGFGIGALVVALWLKVSTPTVSAPMTTYTNSEECEFIRDEITGRTKGYVMKRTAKEAV